MLPSKANIGSNYEGGFEKRFSTFNDKDIKAFNMERKKFIKQENI